MSGPKPKFATIQDFYNEAIKYMSARDMCKKTNITLKTISHYLVKLKSLDRDLHKELLDIWACKRKEESLNVHAFDKMNEESVYWLGMLAANGYIENKSNKISLTSKESDYKHLEAFRDFLKSPNKLCYYVSKSKKAGIHNAVMFSITSETIKNKLREYGIVSAKSNLDIDYISYIPDEFKFAFICGYLDGDGWVVSTRKTIGIMGNISLINHIYDYLLSKGICSYIYKHSGKSTIEKYIVEISNLDSLEKFCQAYLNLDNKYLLERKMELIKQYFNDIHNKNKAKNLKEKIPLCPLCNNPMSSKSKKCLSCYKKEIAMKNTRPQKEELEKLICKLPFVQIGKKYGVTDNAVRKWCKYYDLPYRKKDIKK